MSRIVLAKAVVTDAKRLRLSATLRALLDRLWREAVASGVKANRLVSWIGARYREATGESLTNGVILTAQPWDLPLPGDPTPEEIRRLKVEIRDASPVVVPRDASGVPRIPREVRYHGPGSRLLWQWDGRFD